MLTCERKSSSTRDNVGIRSHWDQSFISQEDLELQRLSAELLSQLCQQTFNYQNLKVPAITRRHSDQGNDTEEEDESCRSYVNCPRCSDRPVVPQTGSGSVPLRTDRSPMSPRSIPAGTTTHGLSSTVAQVALSRLRESGFYYESISPTKARRLLQPYPPGTFLVRASSDQRFLFSLTVRTSELVSGRSSTSVRIELTSTDKFRLDAETRSAHLLPAAPCVLDLLRRHIVDGGGQFVLLDVTEQPGHEMPLMLRRPLYRDARPAALKHLCRRRIHSALDGRSVDRLQLVPSLKQYLNEYPSDL